MRQLGHLQVEDGALHDGGVQGSGDLVDVDADAVELAPDADQCHRLERRQLQPPM